MPFSFVPLGLPGVVLIEPRAFEDARGFFVETYKQSDFAAAGIPDVLVQENHSRSVRGTLRGLHFQRPPMAQGKLVRVLAGEIFDVAVDIRPDSPTFRQWTGVTLSAATRQLVYVPPWCAHGFCVLSESADVLYKTTAEYAPHLESGIAWDDPAVGITWPIDSPVLSDRDRRWPPLDTASGVSGPTGVTR
jgi:dTDP-4-dehydrorhamnose 3,5-epimerase